MSQRKMAGLRMILFYNRWDIRKMKKCDLNIRELMFWVVEPKVQWHTQVANELHSPSSNQRKNTFFKESYYKNFSAITKKKKLELFINWKKCKKMFDQIKISIFFRPITFACWILEKKSALIITRSDLV